MHYKPLYLKELITLDIEKGKVRLRHLVCELNQFHVRSIAGKIKREENNKPICMIKKEIFN